MKMIRLMLITTTAAAMALGGCKGGDKGDSGEPAAKEPAAKSAHERIQGEFGFDADATIAADPRLAEAFKDAHKQLAEIRKIMGAKAMKIGKDTIKWTDSAAANRNTESTYTVKSQDGDTIVLEVQDEGKEEKKTLTLVLSDGDKKLTGTETSTVAPGGHTMVLMRK